jgi:uncharacterized repeat protein (TIGR01451 family)
MSKAQNSPRRRRGRLACSAAAAGVLLAVPAIAQAGFTTQPPDSVDVAITKTADAATYLVGEDITWTIQVHNTGVTTIAADQLQVDDPALSGLPLAPDAGQPAAISPTQSLTYTVVQRVINGDCGDVVNTASVQVLDGQGGTVIETTEGNNSATASVVVDCETDLQITKTADRSSYAPGDVAYFTITVTNAGRDGVPLKQILVSDHTVSDLTLVTKPVPDFLNPGASLVYRASTLVTAQNCGLLSNTATVELLQGSKKIAETNSKNNASSVNVPVVCPVTPVDPKQPEPGPLNFQAPPAGPLGDPAPIVAKSVTKAPSSKLRVTATGPARGIAGQRITYILRVRNVSKFTAKSVVLSNRLPGGLSVAGRGSLAPSMRAGTMTWSLGTLRPGASRTVRVVLRIDSSVFGNRRSLVSVHAANAPRVSASVVTRIAKIAPRVAPAVAG